jgi:hypothetical protein
MLRATDITGYFRLMGGPEADDGIQPAWLDGA